MKNIIAVMLFTASGALYLVPGSAFAQTSSDTPYVLVMPPGNINNVIAAVNYTFAEGYTLRFDYAGRIKIVCLG